MKEALWDLPMSIGWQLIHAYLVQEGCERKWAISGIGELSTNMQSWRDGNPMQESFEEDTDNLAI